MANFSRSFSSEYSLAILRAWLARFGDFLKSGRVLERIAHDDERDDEHDDERENLLRLLRDRDEGETDRRGSHTIRDLDVVHWRRGWCLRQTSGAISSFLFLFFHQLLSVDKQVFDARVRLAHDYTP